jgi:hypothetical protein
MSGRRLSLADRQREQVRERRGQDDAGDRSAHPERARDGAECKASERAKRCMRSRYC